MKLFNDYSVFNEIFEALIKADEEELTLDEAEELVRKLLKRLKVNCMKVRMIRYQARLSLEYKRAYDVVVEEITRELLNVFKSVKNPPIDPSDEEEIERLRRLLYSVLNDVFQCVVIAAGSPKRLWEYVEDPKKRRLLDSNCLLPIIINYVYSAYEDGFKRLALALYVVLATIFYAPRRCLFDVNLHWVSLSELLPLLSEGGKGK